MLSPFKTSDSKDLSILDNTTSVEIDFVSQRRQEVSKFLMYSENSPGGTIGFSELRLSFMRKK